jgi:hypothetical protein
VTVMRAGYQGIERDYYPTTGQSVVLSLPIAPGSGGFTCPGYMPPQARVMQALPPQTQQGESGYQAAEKPAVLILDQYSNPMPGVKVTFSVTQGTGPITPGSVVSGPNGIARLTEWWLSQTAGVNEVTATALGINTSVRFNATGVISPTALVAVSALSQQGTAGAVAPIPPAVVARDRYNNPVAGVTVRFTPGAGGAVSPSSVVTGADGVARLTQWTFAATAGTHYVQATLGNLRVVFNATVAQPVAPSRLGEEALPLRGDPFDNAGKDSCQRLGRNYVLAGLRVKHKVTVLTGIDLFCAPLRADGTMGPAVFLPPASTAGLVEAQAICPAGSAIVGIQGTTDPKTSRIRSLQVYCSTILPTGLASGSPPTRISPALGTVSGNAWGPDMCTKNRPATAVAFHLALGQPEVWNFRLFCEQPVRGT